MALQYSFKNLSGGCGAKSCPDEYGCPPDRCPDFIIRRYDTKPPFKVRLEDCDGPLDIAGLVVEVNMWASAKLKKTIAEDCEILEFADNIGFNQVMVGDIIVVDRPRSPEYMLVVAFDECNNLIRVSRGYRNTTAYKWKKGTAIRIFRVMNSPAQTEIVYDDVETPDGTITEDVVTDAFVVYEWSSEDVCMPGCYWLEFKLLKMKAISLYLPGGHWTGPVHEYESSYYTGTIHTNGSVLLSYDSVDGLYLIGSDLWSSEVHTDEGVYYTGSEHTDGSVSLDHSDMPSESDTPISSVTSNEGTLYTPPSQVATSFSTSVVSCVDVASTCAVSFSNPNLSSRDYGCFLPENIEWVRRFPTQGLGFLVKIENTLTSENLV